MTDTPFMQNMVEDKARQRVTRDTDLIESEWPAHTPAGVASCSGYALPVSGSGAVVMTVPSSRWFKPRTIIVDNQNAALNHLAFYQGGSASACSGYLFGMYIDGHTTQFIGLDCITAGKDIWVQAETVGSTAIYMGGILIPSGLE